MNKKGGLLTGIILIVVAFFVGTFFGWQILGNFFGEDVERLSPDNGISNEALASLCEGMKDEICAEQAEVIFAGDAIQGEIDLASNSSNSGNFSLDN